MDHWLTRAAAMHPQRTALQGLPYAALLEAARGAAGALREWGVQPGGRVAIALATGPEFVAALHGCFLAGAVAVPVDLRLSGRERGERLAGARVVVEEPLYGSPITDVEPLALELVAAIVHTSGTTSAPRPVELTFGNFLAGALGSAVALGLDQDERWLCPMPLVHVGGLSIPIRSAIYGTTAVVAPRFEVKEVLGALMDARQRITLVSLVPTMLARLLDAGLADPPTLRWALLGGGPIPAPLLDRARAAGVPVAPTYGMTEACSQIATFGWPLPGVELRVDGDGELLVRGPTVAPAALAADGWLHTGDLGRLDERGRVSIIGRESDTIITGGENVAPAEVEAVLLEHPAIADVGVFARADPEWGEAVCATVVLGDGLAVGEEELRAFCARRLTAYKVPKVVFFAERLPRTASGKLVRRELKG